jgi:hypothetical protein
MNKRVFYIIFLAFFLLDIGYSFLQYYHAPLDGDMAGGIVPAEDVRPILEDPLGIKCFTENKIYPNPNRFFSHWLFYKYFNVVPILLQKKFTPIQSVYISCAIAKTIFHLIIILLLAIYVTGTTTIRKLRYIAALFIISPLFQANGYGGYMGIIDCSVTYSFFYALPIGLLLLYFTPFVLKFYYKKKLHYRLLINILWIPLALVISLSCPLNPGIVLIVVFLVFLPLLLKKYLSNPEDNFCKRIKVAFQSIPRGYFFYFAPITIFSAYSLYLGQYNSVSISNHMPWYKIYLNLPLGIYYQFTQKLGFPIIFLLLIINFWLIRKMNTTDEEIKLFSVLKWIGIFSLIYILLLPLGGYRPYRSNILRYDTIIPIILALMVIFSKSTLFVIKKISNRQKRWYYSILAVVCIIFINADEPNFDVIDCEINALTKISQSKKDIVKLNSDCKVLTWQIIHNPEESDLNARLLKLWQITDKKKLYVNE